MTMHRWLLAIFVALAMPAHGQPLGCDQQMLDEVVALSRLGGNREFLREHVRSYGCRLIYPREGLNPFPPEHRRRR
jgi:hypothetical protein